METGFPRGATLVCVGLGLQVHEGLEVVLPLGAGLPVRDAVGEMVSNRVGVDVVDTERLQEGLGENDWVSDGVWVGVWARDLETVGEQDPASDAVRVRVGVWGNEGEGEALAVAVAVGDNEGKWDVERDEVDDIVYVGVEE